MGAYTETKLQKTFRYNSSIAETAGTFIMENPEQYKKSIETQSIVSTSQVYLLDDKGNATIGLYERVREIVQKIKQNDPSGSIAIIARYNYLLDYSKQTLRANKLTENIHYWTFHRSKGLEADYSILIGFSQGKLGFPSENKDQAIIEALLPTLDDFPHSEERRLFYVGLTRARKKCYIIADPTAPSNFVTEILSPKYGINISSRAFEEAYRRIFKCPHCEDGYFKLIKGKFGQFYACTSGSGCGGGKARVCEKCSAPSVDMAKSSRCNNIGCRNELKICPVCGRPMKLRNGKRGKFWCCSGYGLPNDSCKHTENLT